MINMIKNYPIPTILGVITVVELYVSKEMSGAILLWVLYGFYKLA